MTKSNSEIIAAVPVFSDLANLGFALRREVFIQEQSVPAAEEFDQKDITATHLVLIKDGDVVSTLRIIWHSDFAQLSRFVVRKSHRGQGFGVRLITHAIEVVRKAGMTKMYLEAQSDKVALYERFGFFPYGEEFLDGGIPHRRMRNYTDAS